MFALRTYFLLWQKIHNSPSVKNAITLFRGEEKHRSLTTQLEIRVRNNPSPVLTLSICACGMKCTNFVPKKFSNIYINYRYNLLYIYFILWNLIIIINHSSSKEEDNIFQNFSV